jgi:hypothetical protein
MKREMRGFVAGMLCGCILIASVWGSSVWLRSRVERSPEDAAIYDACLIGQQGNTIGCDAFMRTFTRVKAKDDALEKILNEGGAKMLAAGASKREVVDWAKGMGGVGRQLSNAAGISLNELQSGKY